MANSRLAGSIDGVRTVIALENRSYLLSFPVDHHVAREAGATLDGRVDAVVAHHTADAGESIAINGI